MANVSLSSFQIPDWQWGGATATLRLYCNKDFIDSTGTPHVHGTIGSKTGFYQEIALTVSGTTVTVATTTIISTSDAQAPPDASTILITGVLFDHRDARRETLFSGWQIPTTTPITFAALAILNGAKTLPQAPDYYLNTTQTQALITIAQGTLNDASDVVKGRTYLDKAPAVASSPIAVGINSNLLPAMINVMSHGVIGDGVADDTAAFQAAIDAASDGTIVYKPGDKVMKISSTISMDNKQGITVRLSEVQDGYGHLHHDIEWVGPINTPIFTMRDCGGCTLEGGFLYSNIVGTGGVDIDVIDNTPTSTSDIVRAMHFNFLKATAVSYGVRLHSTNNNNGERMQFSNIRCSFLPNVGSFNDATNLTRGSAFKIGGVGFGQNVLNLSIEKCYWIGVSYGVDLENSGTNWFEGNESNFASIDYKLVPFSSTFTHIVNHRTESERQFLHLGAVATVTLTNCEIGFGGWDATGTFPVIQLIAGNLKMYGSGFVGTHTAGVKYLQGVAASSLTSRGVGYLDNVQALVDFQTFGYGADVDRLGLGGGTFNFTPMIYYPGVTGGQTKQGLLGSYDYVSQTFYPALIQHTDVSTHGKAIEIGSTRVILPTTYVPSTITAGGTTGAQTINKMSGSVNFAIGATALVVTNSLVNTSSVIIATAATNDATGYVKNVVAASGSFTINLVAAAAAETRVNFLVLGGA